MSLRARCFFFPTHPSSPPFFPTYPTLPPHPSSLHTPHSVLPLSTLHHPGWSTPPSRSPCPSSPTARLPSLVAHPALPFSPTYPSQNACTLIEQVQAEPTQEPLFTGTCSPCRREANRCKSCTCTQGPQTRPRMAGQSRQWGSPAQLHTPRERVFRKGFCRGRVKACSASREPKNRHDAWNLD